MPLLLDGHQVGVWCECVFTPEHFGVAQAATDELLPALKGKRFVRAFNGYMAFSNDLYPIVGRDAAFVGCGRHWACGSHIPAVWARPSPN